MDDGGGLGGAGGARGPSGLFEGLSGEAQGAILRDLFDSAPDAMLVLDRAGVIVLANGRAEHLLGHPRGHLRGHPSTIIAPDLQAATAAGTALGRRANGEKVALEVKQATIATPMGPLVTVSLRQVVTPDVGDENHASVAYARRMRSRFVANMSHALRSPLNSIMGFAKLMQHGKLGPVSEKHREHLGDILNNATHLLAVINDVLDISTIDAGRIEFSPVAIDVAQIIGEVRDVVATAAAAKQIRIEVAVDASCTGVHLDKSKLKQVLYNLLSHVLSFIEHGRIDVRVKVEEGDRLRFEVEDPSRRVPAEVTSQLFSAGDGKQLGLVVARQLVEAQGGRTGVVDAPGQGCTVFAVLPRVMKATAAASPPELGTGF